MIQVKQQENADADAASKKKAQRAKIMELLEKKQDEALASKSAEELLAMIAD